MKTNPHLAGHARSGFTLIELMAVITIIILLAGLVVGGMGFVSDRQAKEKAKTQIALLSKALEEYKLDNGIYPPTSNSNNPPESNTSILFKALYWEGAADSTGTKKIYLPQLDPTNNKQGWIKGAGQSATIIDPWSSHYRYRTATNSKGEPNKDAQNPDFDLWSVGKDGVTKAGANDDPKHKDNKDDIRNF